MDKLRVLLVTSWDTPCGIAEHSRLLKERVEAADPSIEVMPDADALDPESYAIKHAIHEEGCTIVHLNHHDALHSRWTPEHVQRLRILGFPVIVTYHDTLEQLPADHKLWRLAKEASSTVVHEPIQNPPGHDWWGGPASSMHYWRQGVPAPAQQPYHYGARSQYAVGASGSIPAAYFKDFPQQPVLGTVGFDFSWKNYGRLAQETFAAGWALLVISPNITSDRADVLRAFNPHCMIVNGWHDQADVVNRLAGCDATAFMYECANTGTSGAIRQGIAARKPTIALISCRQFRDLYVDNQEQAIWWVDDWDEFRHCLRGNSHTRAGTDRRIHALAESDSWTQLGQRYAQLYREVVGG